MENHGAFSGPAIGDQILCKACRTVKETHKMNKEVYGDAALGKSEFVPPRQAVNPDLYVEVLTKHIVRVRLANANNWRVHHNNVPSPTDFRVVEYLAQNNVTTMPHPPYSPNLAPPVFLLFPRIKSMLKGEHHGLLEAVK
ncbi:histone-lysine N-methyltransferase SETMAR [Trichonephila inaurata madagascariensis]|uniref:Histone-lysine N-methyltransferase SETMAR n=1 Tax=Trichonephila inaurata madagascariensis TaxID=2747483 RepID=A0A8X7BQW4_9ARAC|nr:histone-lysine N-methyltransferase SETMAR [Trichonephila inaurata madagascariensis]